MLPERSRERYRRKRKILLIGGTGTISMAITRRLSETDEVYVLNRGNRNTELPDGVHFINSDINNEEEVIKHIDGIHFDSVCEFIGFNREQVERDIRLFRDRTSQYVYISSASAYNKPVADPFITEGTTLANPFWEYSRNKIACEELLMKEYRENGFPVTIIRPSHTYDERSVPLGVHGKNGSYQVIKRMLEGKKVIIHGDGTSLWTATHNSDFAAGFIGLLSNPHAIGEAFQITGDESLTWNQIYETIAQVLGVPLRACHVSSEFLASCSDYDLAGSLIGDKANTVIFDNSKLKRAVPGWRAKISFREGIQRTIDYIISHPQCQKEDEDFDRWCDDVISELEFAANKIKNKSAQE